MQLLCMHANMFFMLLQCSLCSYNVVNAEVIEWFVNDTCSIHLMRGRQIDRDYASKKRLDRLQGRLLTCITACTSCDADTHSSLSTPEPWYTIHDLHNYMQYCDGQLV